MSEVIEFYDDFSKRQSSTGINHRHLSILSHLQKEGLKKNSNVLEVGCGVGTVSHLILRFLSSQGHLDGVDISPKSIELARQLNKRYRNCAFHLLDLSKETLESKFDVIVLPDVIEHIPTEFHRSLFANLYRMLNDDGFIFIHIPHPNYLEWLIKTGSKELQVIEIPIYTDKFLAILYPLGFYLHKLQSYSVYAEPEDYQILILKKRTPLENFENRQNPFQISWYEKLTRKVSFIVRGFK